MKRSDSRHVVLANGAKGPQVNNKPIILHYLDGQPEQRVRIGLPSFVENVFHIKDRILDLLELASYVFASDRLISRGPKDAVEYHRWGRSIDFYIRVRDYNFWRQPKIRDALRNALLFMTGDANITFHFESGYSTPPNNLFDSPGFSVAPNQNGIQVTLFSGGIDSLSGAIELLTKSDCKVILVSHMSRTGTTHTQKALVEALRQKFPRRVLHYKFECTLRGTRRVEETQRTRSFLYTTIAYAIASSYGLDQFSVYENGVTSINLHRREDQANARASRTTHPQTIAKMASLVSLIEESKLSHFLGD